MFRDPVISTTTSSIPTTICCTHPHLSRPVQKSRRIMFTDAMWKVIDTAVTPFEMLVDYFWLGRHCQDDFDLVNDHNHDDDDDDDMNLFPHLDEKETRTPTAHPPDEASSVLDYSADTWNSPTSPHYQVVVHSPSAPSGNYQLCREKKAYYCLAKDPLQQLEEVVVMMDESSSKYPLPTMTSQTAASTVSGAVATHQVGSHSGILSRIVVKHYYVVEDEGEEESLGSLTVSTVHFPKGDNDDDAVLEELGGEEVTLEDMETHTLVCKLSKGGCLS